MAWWMWAIAGTFVYVMVADILRVVEQELGLRTPSEANRTFWQRLLWPLKYISRPLWFWSRWAKTSLRKRREKNEALRQHLEVLQRRLENSEQQRLEELQRGWEAEKSQLLGQIKKLEEELKTRPKRNRKKDQEAPPAGGGSNE